MNRPVDVRALGGNQAIPALVGEPVPYWLPPGVHPCTLNDVEATFATNEQRQKVWTCFKALLYRFRDAGGQVEKIMVDGSFVTGRELPGDIDVFAIIPFEEMREQKDNSSDPVLFEILSDRDSVRNVFNVDWFILDSQPMFDGFKELFTMGMPDETGRLRLRNPDSIRDPAGLIVPNEKGILELDMTSFFYRVD